MNLFDFQEQKKTEILDFIKNFSEVKEVFLHGLCYWFAYILSNRFDGKIMYLKEWDHFLVLIDTRLYDVRGDVTDFYCVEEIVEWDAFQKYDPIWYERIVRDDIEKISTNDI